MPRNHELRIKLSKEEKKRIESKAKVMGLNVSAFVRHIALTSKIKITEED